MGKWYVNDGRVYHYLEDHAGACVCGFWSHEELVNDVALEESPTGPRPGDLIGMVGQCRPKTVASPSDDRKAQPLYSGVLNYFPDALLAVSRLSKAGNDKHNPGQPLHWAKDKSTDHADCIARHLLEQGKIDPETGLSHTVAVAWRALALLQTEIENGRKSS